MGYDQTGNQANLMLTETAVVNSHLVNETRFQYASNYTGYNNSNLLPQINVSGAFTAGGNDQGTYFNNNHHYELQNLSTYSHGVHTIRWGIRVRRNSSLSESESGFGGTFTFLGEIAPNLSANNQVVTDPSGNPMNLSECTLYPQLCSQISRSSNTGARWFSRAWDTRRRRFRPWAACLRSSCCNPAMRMAASPSTMRLPGYWMTGVSSRTSP